MGAISSPSVTEITPVCAVKEVLVRCSMATGETWDASNYFTKIYQTYICDDSGAVKVATWSSLTVTMGTLSTGVHCLRVVGV